MLGWTIEQQTHVLALLLQGKTCGSVAQIMQKTRNSICGFRHRQIHLGKLPAKALTIKAAPIAAPIAAPRRAAPAIKPPGIPAVAKTPAERRAAKTANMRSWRERRRAERNANPPAPIVDTQALVEKRARKARYMAEYNARRKTENPAAEADRQAANTARMSAFRAGRAARCARTSRSKAALALPVDLRPPTVERGPPQPPRARPERNVALLPAFGLLVHDAGARGCLWPYGDPSQPEFAYCGHPRAPGKGPYCATHDKLSHTAARGPREFTRTASKFNWR